MNRKENEKAAELRDRLREALNIRNMRPIELSEKTGIPKSMVSYYLAGKSKPKADRVYEIAKALDVSEAWLMGYDVPQARTSEHIKNDRLVSIVKQFRADPEFSDIVSMLAELPADQYGSIKALILALRNK